MIGSTAISLISQFVDYAIISASAIDEEGATGFRLPRSQAAQAIIANARSVMLVAD